MSPTQRDTLIDGHGRRIRDVRISVTDRCNLRCTYCMPERGMTWIPRDDILTYEEIGRIVTLLGAMGVSDVRITGGEPLVRKELPKLIYMLGATPGIDDVSLTTNGLLLDRVAVELADAGLSRLNVSLDSLDADRYRHITRRHGMERVMRGLDAVLDDGRLAPVKVNVVALRGFTEDEVFDFVDFARARNVVVRFIEFMPLDADRSWRAESVLTGDEIRSIIETRYRLVPVRREAGATALRWRLQDGSAEIGFVNPVSMPFCSDCNRIRITADGMLRTCLFSLHEVDLLSQIRAGATDADLEQIVRDAVWRKELKHQIGSEGFRQPQRTMSSIGG